MIPGFYWLIDGALAGCSRPGVRDPHKRGGQRDDAMDEAAHQEALDHDLAWLRRQGIDAVLSMTETPLVEDVVARHDLDVLHLPVPDLHAPSPDQLAQALAFIDQQRARGRAVVVHCLVGQGRTGAVLAAYRIRAGATPDEAIHELRALSPGAISAAEQEQALRRFAANRDWIV